ncbi:hypothetical protein N7501_010092 [Penicillium viridicatum]|nr:hypothetical protein N7501_010092 [Penicillium viridicatum]
MVNTEQVSNLITLEIQAHEYWDSPNFAFRPMCRPKHTSSITRTTDPSWTPMTQRPDRHLQWLQPKWNLSRIAAMQGGGEEDSGDDPTLFTCEA